MNLVAPPGWPSEVRPPDAPDWEATAVSWLLDLCPAEYRRYPGSKIRSDLKDVAPLDVVEAAVRTFQLDEARLQATRRAVGLVEEALRGRRFVARL